MWRLGRTAAGGDRRVAAVERHERGLRSLRRERLGVEPEDVERVLISVGEAQANAIEHGSDGDVRRSVAVEIERIDGTLVASISDTGYWGTDSARSAGQGRGRGIAIMERLTQDLDVRRSRSGTTVMLTFELSLP